MYNLNYAPTTLGYKVDENIYLGVHEGKRLSITGVGLFTRDKFNYQGYFLQAYQHKNEWTYEGIKCRCFLLDIFSTIWATRTQNTVKLVTLYVLH
jgi:hypothetical protein